jgi:hypothetical protein
VSRAVADGLKRQWMHSQGCFAAITAMAAGQVGCSDGARSCIISMGLTLLGSGENVLGSLGFVLANSLGVTAMEAMVRRSTIAMMSIQRVFKRLGQKFGVSD